MSSMSSAGERRFAAQTLDHFDRRLDDVVDLLFGVPAPQPIADRRVGQIVGDSQCLQDMRGLERSGSTRGTGRDGDVLESQKQRLSVDVAKRQVEISGQTPLN